MPRISLAAAFCTRCNNNNNLYWQDHVDQMFSKINKKLGLLKHIRYCLPLDARLLYRMGG